MEMWEDYYEWGGKGGRGTTRDKMFLPPSKLIGGGGGACPLFLLFFPLKVAPKEETFVIYFLLFHINTEWKCGSIIMSGVVWGAGGRRGQGTKCFAPPSKLIGGLGVAPSSSYSFV